MEKKSLLLRLLYKLVSIQIKTNFPIGDIFAFYYYRNRVIAQGVKFVSQYKNIYTTRLHVAILSILLNKPFFFFDNSYGKNSSFFDTWLFDLDNVEFIARKICPRE